MVEKGNKDGHRYGISDGPKAVETQKWGVNKSDERYGRPKYLMGAPYPKDQTVNQDPAGRPMKVGAGDIPSDSWLRGGAKGGESYSGYVKTGDNPPKNTATAGSGGRKKSPGFK